MTEKPFSLSVKVLIRDSEGRCLVLRRSLASKGSPGKWEFPGGKADPGEDFDEALRREVAEETGLRVSLERVAGATEYELPDRKVAYLIMEACHKSGQVCLSDEHDDYAWVCLEDLPGIELVEQFGEFAAGYVDRGRG